MSEYSYPRFNNFRICVIEPIIQTINKYTNLMINYTKERAGSVVASIIFKIRKKTPSEEQEKWKNLRQDSDISEILHTLEKVKQLNNTTVIDNKDLAEIDNS